METPEGPPAENDMGEFASVPVEDWIPTPVSDSAEYLDREPPVYVEEGDDGEASTDQPA